MSGGIRAEVKIQPVDACRVATASANRNEAISDVSRSAVPEGDTVVEEFSADASTDIDDDRIEPVFSYDSQVTYRFTRSADHHCPCTRIEQFGYPVSDTTIVNGSIVLTFHVEGLEQLREVITDLRDHYTVSIERLVRSGCKGESTDLVYVDRGELTERQMEVLETAHEMGYFEHSTGANAGEVADALDISTSTFTEHLAAAQRKLLTTIVDS
jgi:hypothetical protein